jgi:Protein of unknown function (DUF2652)
VHGQLCITSLIETLLREVDIPLHLQAIEGDAVFLYAANPGDDKAWQKMLAEVRKKLVRFFEVFIEAMVTAGEATPCKCAICRNAKELALKIIVHSGRAVFNTVGGLPQVSGTDVILAHRLLKNSVPSHEYLLMTEAAYQDLGREMSGEFVKRDETCEGFGRVTTYVQFMGYASQRARDAFYSMPPDALRFRVRQYVRGAGAVTQFRAALEQIRHPVKPVGWLRRAGFLIYLVVSVPVFSRIFRFAVPRRVLAQKEARVQPAH